MKAAVLHRLGSVPVYEDMPDPVPQQDGQIVMSVKAASVKNLDKMRAAGHHYASYTKLPAIVGIDGVGVLEDGTPVYAQGIHGTIAEKALIHHRHYAVLPKGLDFALAAALPNAVIGSAMALRYRARMKPGDSVLINGATGVTGQLAVQIAKHYGASRIIATGRNRQSLEKLKALGADALISLKQDDDAFMEQLKALHQQHPIGIVIDYLWGHPAELVINALKGGGLHNHTHPVRIVTAGSMAGESIRLPSGILRSSAIEILGSGIGSLSKDDMHAFRTDVLPEIFQLAAEGRLTMDTDVMPLRDIETAWEKDMAPGRRLVITM